MDTRLMSKVDLLDEFNDLQAPFGKKWKSLVKENDPFYRTDKGERVLTMVKEGRASVDKIRIVVEILRLVSQPSVDKVDKLTYPVARRILSEAKKRRQKIKTDYDDRKKAIITKSKSTKNS